VFFFTKMWFVLLSPPAFPHRGELVHELNFYLVRLNVLILWVVIFWATYEARVCARLVEAMNKTSRLRLWPSSAASCKEAEFAPVRIEDLSSYLDFRLIARATRRIQWLIYLPFVSILFMVLARSDLFDAMDFPLPLIAVIVLALSYAIYSEVLLRRCALSARSKALKEYDEKLFALEGGRNDSIAAIGARTTNHRSRIIEQPEEQPEEQPVIPNREGADPIPPPITAEQIAMLMNRIRETREGAFAPFSQQPALQALLLPFGGYGSVQLMEFFIK
jgi:hypothetical protein